MMMDAVSISETSKSLYQTARHSITEDRHFTGAKISLGRHRYRWMDNIKIYLDLEIWAARRWTGMI
jgi:hypothetical protein